MRHLGLSRGILIVGTAALGFAVQIGNGNLWENAIAYFSAASVAILLAFVLALAPAHFERPWEGLGSLLGYAALGAFVGPLISVAPGKFVLSSLSDRAVFTQVMAFAAVLAAVGISAAWPERRRQVAWVVLLIGLHVFLARWLLVHSPNPRIDVFTFEKDSVAALISGRSPYAITFHDPYLPFESARFYGAGLSVGGRLQFGFPYFPLTLMLIAPAEIIARDPRWSMLVATELAALCMVFIGRRRFGLLGAVLLLFLPRGLFVLEQAWTEPLMVALFAVTVLVAVRAPRWLWLPLGLFVASKQYAFLAAPFALLLLPRPLRWRDVWSLAAKSAAVAIVTTLPFLLWNPDGFIRSVVTLQFHQPFREESLSFMAWLWASHHLLMPEWISFAAAALVLALALWRAPRTPFGFALSSATLFFVFFALNKQAFANYYYLVTGLLCVAIAASESKYRGAAPAA